jgi:hypothetical protein
MNSGRYLCSQLVAMTNNSVECVVNLEEIWANGAVLESEEAVEEGAKVEIRCGPAFFSGRVVQVDRHECGWRFELEFSPMTHWSLEQFQPLHLLDPSKLERG